MKPYNLKDHSHTEMFAKRIIKHIYIYIFDKFQNAVDMMRT